MGEVRALAAVGAFLLTLGVFFTFGAPSPFSGQELEPNEDNLNATNYNDPESVFDVLGGLINDVNALATSGNPILLALASLFGVIVGVAIVKLLPFT